MKTNTLISFLAAAFLAILAVSCQDDKTLYYNNMTMGNVVDGRFVSDKGNIFNVVDQTCDGKVDTMKRAIMVCDVLNVTKGEENAYDIRINQLASVLTKAPIAAADAAGDIEVKDHIHISEIWYSGGYLNMYVMIPVKAGSKVKHLVNLAYEVDEEGRFVFEMRHNAFGDTMGSGDGVFGLGGSYVSFPILDIVNNESAKFIIRWKWFEEQPDGYGWTKVEKEYKVEYEWKREGFEQVPQTIALRSGSEIR